MSKPKSILKTFASVLLLAVAAQPAAVAESPAARVILVLDASGSMWGQIEGRPKIEIARQVIRDLLQDWDAGVHLGLTAYGHRRKGDCGDIESLIAPGPVNAARVIAAVDALNPKGKTPLSDAVVHAARELRYEEERATVILVSDGIETCDRDPCAVARELEAAGVDFTAYVIGFDVVEENALAQLRCLAENTGGEFTPARDAGALKDALGRAVESARISLRAPEIVFSGQAFEVEWSGPNGAGDKIAIVPAGSAEGTPGAWAATSDGSPARLVGPATSGPHEVRYVSGSGERTLLELEITARGSLASLEAPESVVAGGELEVTWTGPDAAGDRIALVPAAESDERYFTGKLSARTSAGSPAKLRAFTEPGRYEIRYLATKGARVLARRAIEIAPAGVSLDAPARSAAGYELEVRWTGPAHQGDRIVLVEAGAPEGRYSTKGDFTQATTAGSPVRLTAYSEPGDYEIRYMAGLDGKTLAASALTVTPSEARIEVPSRVAADAEFEVRWTGPNSRGDRIVIVKEGAAEGSYYSGAHTRPTENGSPLKLRAFREPGAYEVRYLAGGDGKTLARATLEIIAGE